MKKYWLYGKHSVLAALENPKRVKYKIIVNRENSKDLQQYSLNIPVIISEKPIKELTKEGDGSISNELSHLAHQNIFLQTESLVQPSFEAIYPTLDSKKKALVIVLDQITDPRNIGAIIRLAAAFEVVAIVLPFHKTPTETGVMVKAASGAFERVPLVYVNNLTRAIEQLKEIGYWAIGFSSHASATLDPKLNIYEKVTLVFGSEDKGMRRLLLEKCDLCLKINMNSSVESLNVSNAVAIASYHFYSIHHS